MYRCLIALAASAAIAVPALAQTRSFPQNALRGTLVFGSPPVVALNGNATRLAPGARIRGTNNMLVMSGELVDLKIVVNYTYDTSGYLRDVWILTDDEIKVRPWPTNLEQAQAWSFDPATQVWTKP
ncbi:hypothetical protein [Piscinibacter gummiphilus]|uniref:Uncharacterized protein n=1 Tax=Piscinibacter gummiphilus TaxID=946333 RepID=A0A1W6LEU3_9BURK|nr:hypothetical protein [Piscinibacter gummiphilus]ARN22792.1 hypothetical protein A4W93_24370 [Piscinibacter gummiphilus]ATU67489.1 hypothetical protein CPZ87_24500 [Piscinibacter gummiphilus]GLS96602.1 hypothetical protein GCM10007918_38940 [Piscinibacter gummiphilus]